VQEQERERRRRAGPAFELVDEPEILTGRAQITSSPPSLLLPTTSFT
jgi:hypothetical protein